MRENINKNPEYDSASSEEAPLPKSEELQQEISTKGETIKKSKEEINQRTMERIEEIRAKEEALREELKKLEEEKEELEGLIL